MSTHPVRDSYGRDPYGNPTLSAISHEEHGLLPQRGISSDTESPGAIHTDTEREERETYIENMHLVCPIKAMRNSLRLCDFTVIVRVIRSEHAIEIVV